MVRFRGKNGSKVPIIYLKLNLHHSHCLNDPKPLSGHTYKQKDNFDHD